MKNMALTKEERKGDSLAVDARVGDAEKYPYGLEISLETASIAKLGITELPKVGTKLTLEAKVVVESVSESEKTNGKPRRRIGLQITDMSLGENPGDKKKRHVSTLYPTGQ